MDGVDTTRDPWRAAPTGGTVVGTGDRSARPERPGCVLLAAPRLELRARGAGDSHTRYAEGLIYVVLQHAAGY